MTDCDTCLEAVRSLARSAESMGVEMSERQRTLFVRFCELLLDAGARVNLTAMRTPESIMRGLILDSLALDAILPDLGDLRDVRAVDVGSGGGVPGLPLAIMHPDWTVSLVESVGKKARFLTDAVAQLGLTQVIVVNSRAEVVGRDDAFRDDADLCTARAVGSLPTLIELCAPLVKSGGVLAFPKSAGMDEEIARARPAAALLGVRLESVHRVPRTIRLGAEHVVVLYRKIAPTPLGYPRRIGLAAARPIRT